MTMTVIHGLSNNPTEKRTLALIVWVFSFFFVRFREVGFCETVSLCCKTLSNIAPPITFFRNFALDSQTQRVGNSESVHIIKVLLKFYLLKSNFANLNFHGDKVGNSTCIGCLYPAVNGRLYSKIGVGLLFYPWNR